MSLKQMLCMHDFAPAGGYSDKEQNCWVKISACKKCDKRSVEKIYYLAKCKLTGKTCKHSDDKDFDNCRFCTEYIYR